VLLRRYRLTLQPLRLNTHGAISRLPLRCLNAFGLEYFSSERRDHHYLDEPPLLTRRLKRATNGGLALTPRHDPASIVYGQQSAKPHRLAREGVSETCNNNRH
jgi:hypothetical protein